MGVQNLECPGNAGKRVPIGLKILFSVRQQVTALSAFGIHQVALQLLDIEAHHGHLAQAVQRAHRILVRTFTDQQHRQRRCSGQWEHHAIAFDDCQEVHF